MCFVVLILCAFRDCEIGTQIGRLQNSNPPLSSKSLMLSADGERLYWLDLYTAGSMKLHSRRVNALTQDEDAAYARPKLSSHQLHAFLLERSSTAAVSRSPSSSAPLRESSSVLQAGGDGDQHRSSGSGPALDPCTTQPCAQICIPLPSAGTGALSVSPLASTVISALHPFAAAQPTPRALPRFGIGAHRRFRPGRSGSSFRCRCQSQYTLLEDNRTCQCTHYRY